MNGYDEPVYDRDIDNARGNWGSLEICRHCGKIYATGKYHTCQQLTDHVEVKNDMVSENKENK